MLRGHSCVTKQGFNLFRQFLCFEIPHSQINCHAEIQAHLVPAATLEKRPLKDPESQRNNQASSFGHRYKLIRKNHSMLGMLPAEQHLYSGDSCFEEVYLWLEG